MSRRSLQALVTAETQNRLLVVDLSSGRVVRRLALPPDPENVAADRGVAVVVSSADEKVTVLDRQSLRLIKTIATPGSPHIPAISPDGEYAYVTEDAGGTLTVIRLSDLTVTSRVPVGAGAHPMSFLPDERRLWIALGESATEIAILDTSDPARPHVLGRFDPGFAAHDLSFTPDGRSIWISSARGTDVGVFDAASHRLLFRVPVGPPPQHIAFDRGYVYLTSGYGGTIEQVDAATGRVLRRAPAPYGSFELAVADGVVAASSLLRGTLAIYTPQLRFERVITLAPAARDVAIGGQRGASSPPSVRCGLVRAPS